MHTIKILREYVQANVGTHTSHWITKPITVI